MADSKLDKSIKFYTGTQGEYELTKDGEPTSVYPDKDNHSIDAVRYGLEQVWKRRGQ